MFKKLIKFLLFTATIAAAITGLYYYFQKQGGHSDYDVEDFDDLDDFDDDLDDDLNNKKDSPLSSKDRSYVSLDLDRNAAEVEDLFDDENQA